MVQAPQTIYFVPCYLAGNATLWLLTLGQRHGPMMPDENKLGLNWTLTVVGLVEFVAVGIWFGRFFQ